MKYCLHHGQIESMCVVCPIPALHTGHGRRHSSMSKEATLANSVELPRDWVCSGNELKPKSGASSSNTWVLSGNEIKPKAGASSSNTWVWDGKELKPKTGASSSNTWVVDTQKVKPKVGASSSNTYNVDGQSILVIAGQLALRLW
ncbi:MAG: hypothetical protein ACT6RO_12330 [Hydrogenophaga sp.]|uniref:hypothetical protein n=2 Tax=Hydrogenophaga sp. TaxID=1904254 RepID=UPI0040355580